MTYQERHFEMTEFFDVVDEAGQPTGKVISRDSILLLDKEVNQSDDFNPFLFGFDIVASIVLPS